MTTERIGSCSLCGGDVMAVTGFYHSIVPPPPPTCSQCGAVERGGRGPVIDMEPAVGGKIAIRRIATSRSNGGLTP